MSSKPKVSINIPAHQVVEVRSNMKELCDALVALKAFAVNQSQLYRALANGGKIRHEADGVYVMFKVGDSAEATGD